VFSYLQNKEAIKELFGEVAQKVGDRPGGYTRIIKLGHRFSDTADICFIELVDFDENMAKAPKAAKRTRRGGKKAAAAEAPKAEEVAAEAPKAEEVAAEAPAAEEAKAE
jgi:large subunit ribosomal protein L17